MSAEERSFIRAILDAPEDDAPRLVYADWLDEHARTIESPCPTCTPYLDERGPSGFSGPGYHPERDPASGRHEGGWTNCKTCNGGGNPNAVRCGVVRALDGRHERAEFIRVQVAEPHYQPNHHQAGALAKPKCRADELLAANGAAWLGRWYEYGGRDWYWERGFLGVVYADTAGFLEHAETLFAAHPVISVSLTDATFSYNGLFWRWQWSLPRGLVSVVNDPAGCFDPKKGIGHSNEKDCRAALSRQAVAYGRRLAGLPPLAAVTGLSGAASPAP